MSARAFRRGMILLLAMWLAPAVVAASQPVDDEVEQTGEEEAQDDDELSWELSARVRPRGEARFNQHFGFTEDRLARSVQPDEAAMLTQQTRLSAGVERAELSGRLTLQHTAQWGEFGGDELTHPPLQLYEGWISYEPVDEVAVDLGRFELAYGDERVLGAVGWSQQGRTWDGLRTRIHPVDDINVDVFGARYGSGEGSAFANDSYLTGLYATAEDPFDQVLAAADLYLLYDLRSAAAGPGLPDENNQLPQDDDPAGGDNEDELPEAVGEQRQLTMIGTRLVFDWAGLDATMEAAGQFGSFCPDPGEGLSCRASLRPIRAFFADLEVGYSVDLFRGFVAASIAPGDDPETDTIEGYQEMYPTGHAFLGYMDLIGPRTNILEYRGGAELNFDAIRAELAAHYFQQFEPVASPLGTELNLKVFADATEGLSIGAGGGLFIPARDMTVIDERPQGLASWTFLQATGVF